MIKIHFIAKLNYYIHNEDFTLKKNLFQFFGNDSETPTNGHQKVIPHSLPCRVGRDEKVS